MGVGLVGYLTGMVTFRKSKKIGPLRLTVTPRGLSTSVGVKGARVSVNSRGEVRRTVGIPGTGIYDTKKIGGPAPAQRRPQARPQPYTLQEPAEVVVARMFRSLPPDGAQAVYEAFRADADQAVADMRASLVAAQWPPHLVDELTPAIWSYLHRWTNDRPAAVEGAPRP